MSSGNGRVLHRIRKSPRQFYAGYIPHPVIERAVYVLADEVTASTGFQYSLIAQGIWNLRQ